MNEEELQSYMNNIREKFGSVSEEEYSKQEKQRPDTPETRKWMKTAMLKLGENLHDASTKGINDMIQRYKEDEIIDNAKGISDGYHTFQELYDMRLALTVALFKKEAHLAMRNFESMNKARLEKDLPALPFSNTV